MCICDDEKVDSFHILNIIGIKFYLSIGGPLCRKTVSCAAIGQPAGLPVALVNDTAEAVSAADLLCIVLHEA